MEGDFLVLEDSYDKVENIEECYIPVRVFHCIKIFLINPSGADPGRGGGVLVVRSPFMKRGKTPCVCAQCIVF